MAGWVCGVVNWYEKCLISTQLDRFKTFLESESCALRTILAPRFGDNSNFFGSGILLLG